jgi:multidrug transporter EmrE-like cation transporter
MKNIFNFIPPLSVLAKKGIIIGLILAITDILSFSITKYINVHNSYILLLIIPFILYGCQILIFYYGLNNVSMSELNIIWNVFSSILVSIIGIYIFSEKINLIKCTALITGIISIILFTINN